MNDKINVATTIKIREYKPEDAKALAAIYYNTIHRINIRDYSKAQLILVPMKIFEHRSAIYPHVFNN